MCLGGRCSSPHSGHCPQVACIWMIWVLFSSLFKNIICAFMCSCRHMRVTVWRSEGCVEIMAVDPCLVRYLGQGFLLVTTMYNELVTLDSEDSPSPSNTVLGVLGLQMLPRLGFCVRWGFKLRPLCSNASVLLFTSPFLQHHLHIYLRGNDNRKACD